MSTRNSEFVVRHVIVALDASAHSLAALCLATELAAEAKAELVGLFVEDARLLKLATSPRAQEVFYPSGKHQPLNTATMEQRLQAQAEQARRALASTAGHAQVRWSFRVVRGEVAAEVLTAAAKADVLALGKSGWSLAKRLRIGSTALAATQNPPRALLLVQGNVEFRRQVFVIDNGSKDSRLALIAGANLARAYGNTIVVLIPSEAAGAAERIADEARELLDVWREHLHVRVRRLPGSDVLSISHAVQSEGGGILLLVDANVLPEALDGLLQHLGSPILLVR
jgi:nucleotide-binding universal stress UspA family protein